MPGIQQHRDCQSAIRPASGPEISAARPALRSRSVRRPAVHRVGDRAPGLARPPCQGLRSSRSATIARASRQCGSARWPTSTCWPARSPKPLRSPFGVVSPISGRASIAFCAAAIKAAMAGEVDAVVAAPQHETSIAQAGIAFDGHPSFVARQTGTDESGVYMMLCFGDTRIAHCTLHRSVREAIALITRENVARTIRATDAALKRLGIASAEDRGERPQSARRRRRAVRPRGNRDHQAGDGSGCRGRHRRRRPVRRRHHVPHAGLRRLRRHAARPGPHRDEAAWRRTPPRR